MKYQKIMARTLPEEVTQGTLEGDIKPGDITFYRLQSTADNKLRAYVPRVKFFLWQHVPLVPSASLPFLKWADSIDMF